MFKPNKHKEKQKRNLDPCLTCTNSLPETGEALSVTATVWTPLPSGVPATWLALAAASVFEGSRIGVLVGAVIVEHGLQPETKAVAEATAKTLTELGASPVEVRAVKVAKTKAGGPEAAARTARYAALDAAADELGAKFVMLAHTLNDQAETVLPQSGVNQIFTPW